MGQDRSSNKGWKIIKRGKHYAAQQIGGARRIISLHTKEEAIVTLRFKDRFEDEIEARESLSHAELGKAHLKLSNPLLTKHTWGKLMGRWCCLKQNGRPLKKSTRARRIRACGKGVWSSVAARLLCDASVAAIIVEAIPHDGQLGQVNGSASPECRARPQVDL